MRAIHKLALCNLSRGAWLGGLSLFTAAYVLHSTTDLISEGWAQERGKLTSRASSDAAAGVPGPLAEAGLGESSRDERAEQLLREGARIVNQAVNCRGVGDRLLVELPQTSAPVVALENLAAQRILKAIQDDIDSERWTINGSITEFQGRNYILLDRVTRDSKR